MTLRISAANKNLPLLLLLLFIACSATAFILLAQDPRLVSSKARFKDGEQNLALAYNTFRYGTFSDSLSDKPNPLPSNRREPLYPILLAGALHQIAQPEQLTMQCLLTAKPPACLTTLQQLKGVSAVVLLAVTLTTFLSTRVVIGGTTAPIVAAVWTGLNPSLFLSLNDFYSDLFASLLCLILSTSLYLTLSQTALTKNERRFAQVRQLSKFTWLSQAAAFVSGIALGCLILVKAVFIYVGILVAAGYIIAAQRLKSWQPIKRGFVVLLVSYFLVGGWMMRNYIELGDARVAGRNGEILAIRAEFSTMTWKEYALSFCAYTPICASNLLRNVDPLAYAHFHSSKPIAFYSRIKERIKIMRQADGRPLSANQSEIDRQLSQEAIALIRKNWLKHLALTLTFAYRGMLPHFPYFIAFFAFISVALRTRNYSLWLFLIPSIYSVAVHSMASHYIERYSVPLLPSLSVLLSPLFLSWIQTFRKN